MKKSKSEKETKKTEGDDDVKGDIRPELEQKKKDIKAELDEKKNPTKTEEQKQEEFENKVDELGAEVDKKDH